MGGLLGFSLLLGCCTKVAAQAGRSFTRADTLRGSFTTPGRAWWDVVFYDLHVAVNPNDSSISGYNGITYRVPTPGPELQHDLLAPLAVATTVPTVPAAASLRR